MIFCKDSIHSARHWTLPIAESGWNQGNIARMRAQSTCTFSFEISSKNQQNIARARSHNALLPWRCTAAPVRASSNSTSSSGTSTSTSTSTGSTKNEAKTRPKRGLKAYQSTKALLDLKNKKSRAKRKEEELHWFRLGSILALDSTLDSTLTYLDQQLAMLATAPRTAPCWRQDLKRSPPSAQPTRSQNPYTLPAIGGKKKKVNNYGNNGKRAGALVKRQ